MIAYVETSAILEYVCKRPRGDEIKAILDEARYSLTSVLTRIECARVLHREAVLAHRRAWLMRALEGYETLPMADEILSRAMEGFPAEPVRTLDAIHLATAVMVAEEVPGLTVVALDMRVRKNATAFGMSLLPVQPPTK